MRPQWLARLWCRLFWHTAVYLDDSRFELKVGEVGEVPIVCDRCLMLDTVTAVRTS